MQNFILADQPLFHSGQALGSTAIMTDASGVRTSEARYKAWGETRYAAGTLPTTYKFSGQREDSYIWAFDSTWHRKYFDLGIFYGYFDNRNAGKLSLP